MISCCSRNINERSKIIKRSERYHGARSTGIVLSIERLHARDPAAIEALVYDYHENIYRLALSILNDPAKADDPLNGLEGHRRKATLS
jgi:hypothetical protein